jgi:hypothetical protein
MLDEEDEQVEVAWDERLFPSVAREHAPPGREHELTESVARHPLPTPARRAGN